MQIDLPGNDKVALEGRPHPSTELGSAALTYLGSLFTNITDESKYMLVAGAVAGGGLTVIANAPNPAGVALVKLGFEDESIGAVELLLGALGPTAVAAVAFLLL